MALGVWSHGLAGHTGIDRIRRDLIAERINWALGIAQIVIPMHFLSKSCKPASNVSLFDGYSFSKNCIERGIRGLSAGS